MAWMVHCVKLGQERPGLDEPPIPGDLGQRIMELLLFGEGAEAPKG
jgi:Fe-S cluster biosynthesis and repair protein YggX